MSWSDLKSAFNKVFQNAVGPVITGSGMLVSETIEVHGFDRIVAEGGFRLNITQSGTESVTVITDDNILPHLMIEIVNRTLYLKPKGDEKIHPTQLTYEVQCTELSHLTVNGSGEVMLNHINATTLMLQTNGSGRLSGQGTVKSLEIDINGSGTYEAQSLIAQKVNVEIAGAGDVAVHATQALSVTIRGSGKVTYQGNPTVEKVIQGAGSVRQAP